MIIGVPEDCPCTSCTIERQGVASQLAVVARWKTYYEWDRNLVHGTTLCTYVIRRKKWTIEE